MTGRTLAMTLAAWSCGLATTCWAQGYAGNVVTLPPEAGGFSYSSGAFGDSGPAYGGMPPAGFAGPANCPPGTPYGPATCDPEPACWWKLRPLLISPRLLKPARGSFVRVEYLLWEIEEPGNVLLGAEPDEFLDEFVDSDFDLTAHPDDPNRIFDTNFDPSDGFIGFDPETGLVNFSYVPRMEELQLRDNSGLRLTLGIPTYDYGTIELSGWMLEQATDDYRFAPRELIPPFRALVNLDTDADPETGFPSTGVPFLPSTLVNVNGTNSGLFHESYSFLDVAYNSDIWGADAKFVVDALAPEGEGLKLMPLFGFKYIGFQERMEQRGVFVPDFGETVVSHIKSDTYNTIMGGTIGLRTELVHRWFVLGVQPAVTFAGNVSQTRVATERFLNNSDPYREAESDYFDFSPVLDLQAYARICLSDNMRLTVGYDAFWLSRVYRASRVIDYNVATDPTVPGGLRTDFGTKDEDDHVAVEGLSVGLEFIF